MLTNAKGKTTVLLWILGFTGPALSVEKKTNVVISGWPLEVGNLGQAVLSEDPLMGTLVCPSLTRLNLNALKSEAYLLEKLDDNGEQWTFKLKSGLKWWDKSAVSGEQLAEFLRLELPVAVEKQGLRTWHLPAMDLTVNGPQVTIHWKSKPLFGPYVLNNSPFRQKFEGIESLAFQCAGELKPEKEASTVHLIAANGLRLDLQPSSVSNDPPFIDFRFGEELHPNRSKRQLDEALKCDQAIDTPFITLLAWNPAGRWTSDPTFRRAMTHLIPRGALLRSGAGSLGDLISGPILRAHPGYKRNLLVPAYDLGKAEQLLNKLGYKRSEQDGYRRTPQGELMELRILVHDFEGSTLLRKVLDDSLRAIGLKTVFTGKMENNVDAVLASVASSWPDANLSSFLHSKSVDSPWPWRYQDAALDQALVTYALSLTRLKPDFTFLEKVHDLVYKLEPFSILMQHRVCLEAKLGAAEMRKLKIGVKNPDWFAELLDPLVFSVGSTASPDRQNR